MIRNKELIMKDDLKFNCYIDDKIIKEFNEQLKDNGEYDKWEVADYGNDELAVDYNMCIYGYQDSAFYILVKNKDTGFWEHDCNNFYRYNIDFNNPNWKIKLKKAAIKAYEHLFNKEN